MANEVAVREAAVPDLAPTPATQITADDIAIPRLYVGNQMSTAVADGNVKFGDLFLATDSEDPEPQVLWSLGSDDPGVLAYVLHLWKGKSWQASPGAPIERFEFDDPRAPEDAYTTYNYTLFLPEVDEELPAKMLLKKGSKGTATRINTLLVRNAGVGPAWATAWRITTAKRQRDNNTWAIHVATPAEAQREHVQAAGLLFEQIAPTLRRGLSTTQGDEPAI